MNTEAEHPDSHSDGVDLLDRATEALRNVPGQDGGPSPLLIAKTVHTLRRADSTGARRFWSRGRFIAALAASLALAVGTAAYGPALLDRWKNPSKFVSRVEPPTVGLPSPSHTPIVPPQPSSPAIARISPAPDSAQSIPDGIITGSILFDGVAPARVALASPASMPDCVRLHGGPFYDESLVVSPKGGLANVVVSVSDGLSGWLREEFPPPAEVAVLDQQKCAFVPHVVAVMVGQQLLVKNSDPMVHNVHVLAVNNPQANLGQLSMGEAETGPFESPEVFRVKCDVHPWMEAWVRVVDNPFFAVTGPDGRFTIRGLPPGTYTLKAWHEQLGIREQQVRLVAGQGTASEFRFQRGAR